MKKNEVLFVDDEKSVLNIIKRTLSSEPYSLIFAESGAAGLEILKEHSPALIVSDMNMPEMDGVEFLKCAAELHPESIRIILSGYSNIGKIIEAINLNHIYRYITKPWEEGELKIVIKQALEYFNLIEAQKIMTAKIEKQNEQLKEFSANLEIMVENRTLELMVKDKILHHLLEIHPPENSIDFILCQFCEVIKPAVVVFFKYEQDTGLSPVKSFEFSDDKLNDNTQHFCDELKKCWTTKFDAKLLGGLITSNNATPELKAILSKYSINNFIINPVQNKRNKFGILINSFSDCNFINIDMIKKVESFSLYLAIALNDSYISGDLNILNKNIGTILESL